ncbi:MAG: DUF192 domain-containing protein [Thermoleophilia bacterium]|nr:DUF192 domain-containing protein [Thermoleophilia bacterium]
MLAAVLLIGWNSGCGNSTDGTSPASAISSAESLDARVIFHASDGHEAELKVEVARTEEERATGLMNREELDADSGMIFVWDKPVRGGFWMKDTYIPLSIAFIAEGGAIVDIQEMKAQDPTVHVSKKPYIYAVEANKAWFADHGIKIGDRAEFIDG